MAVVDISGVYLNADMTLGVPVHMRLDQTMTEIVTDIDARYSKYVDARGGVIVGDSASQKSPVWVLRELRALVREPACYHVVAWVCEERV